MGSRMGFCGIVLDWVVEKGCGERGGDRDETFVV